MGNSSINGIFGRVVMAMAILFLFPSVSSLDYCDFTSYKEECNKLIDYPIPGFVKEIILEYLFYDNEIPKHEEVFNWNNNQQVNLDGKSNGVIKDAYLKLLPVSPSVLINDKLYITDKGKVTAKYNHRLELPSGNDGGDCRTTYEFTDEYSDARVYINDIQIGNGVINEFSNLNLQQDSIANVKVEYEVWAEYLVGHYYEHRYCADWDYDCDEDGDCEKYCSDWDYECKFGYHERRKDNLILTDDINAYFFKRTPYYEFKVLNKYHENINGKITAFNFSSFELNFNNAFLKQFNYFYSLNFDDDNLITIKANEKEKIENKNLIFEKLNETYNFNVKDENCEITLRDHFYETKENCNLEFNKLKIETDKTFYDEGESIKVSIKPEDIPVTLTYNNYEVSVENEVYFIASKNNDEITAKLNGYEVKKKIYVKNNEALDILAKLVVFAYFVYFTFKIAKKYSGGENG